MFLRFLKLHQLSSTPAHLVWKKRSAGYSRIPFQDGKNKRSRSFLRLCCACDYFIVYNSSPSGSSRSLCYGISHSPSGARKIPNAAVARYAGKGRASAGHYRSQVTIQTHLCRRSCSFIPGAVVQMLTERRVRRHTHGGATYRGRVCGDECILRYRSWH